MLFHIDTNDYFSENSNKTRIALAIISAIKLAKENDTHQILIYSDVLSSLNGPFRETLGEENFKNLKKSRQIMLDAVNVFLEVKSSTTYFKKGILIAIFPSINNLNSILTNYRVVDSIYIPYSASDFSTYITTYLQSERLACSEE